MNLSTVSSLLAMLLAAAPACADPDDFLLTTYAQSGLQQINLALGSTGLSGQPRDSHATLGYGYGVSELWFSELYVSYDHTEGSPTTFDSAAWQNIFRLTEGQWPLDIGLYTEAEYENDRTTGDKLTFGPLLQSDFGLTTLNLNFLFHRNYAADSSYPMSMGYQWQVKRRISQAIELGFQGFGDVGQWNRWAPHDQQVHRLGPVILGKFALGNKQVLNYNAAVLFDEFDGAHATTLRAQLTYGF
ncbi:MAG: hypothetical protein JO269_02050 [Burkholderiaceae bacterium]|nr:hypothetical protein [Burkholderiaceae bacterium]